MTLTARAQMKLTALTDAEGEWQILLGGTQRRLSELSRIVDVNPGSDRVADMEHEIARLRGKMADLQQRHAQHATLNARIRQWIAQNAAFDLEDAKATKAKLKTGESHVDGVKRIRAEIAALVTERMAVQRAGLPKDAMKAMARAYVAEKAVAGRPRIRADHATFEVSFALDNWDRKRQIEDVLSWFDPETMIARLDAEIDAMPTASGQLLLTPPEKTERLAAITISILELDRQEAAMIDAAQTNDQFIAHRDDISPQAVLGVRIRMPEAVAA